MKSYRTLALKELLSQKVTSILILIAVVLSTMMTTIVGQSIGVLSAMREQQAIAIGGNRYFSLDYDINVEHEAMVLVLTPADIFEQKEENARLYEALASLPEKQRNRITSHFLLGMSLSDIAKSEGTGVSSVHEGIQRGLRRLKKILEKMNTDPENYHQK